MKIINEMKTLNEIRNIISQHKDELKKRFKVKEIGIFGSCVKGGQSERSDTDVLVEFSEPIGIFAFMDLEEYLEKLIGNKIDLVSKKALKPFIGKHILSEVVPI